MALETSGDFNVSIEAVRALFGCRVRVQKAVTLFGEHTRFGLRRRCWLQIDRRK